MSYHMNSLKSPVGSPVFIHKRSVMCYYTFTHTHTRLTSKILDNLLATTRNAGACMFLFCFMKPSSLPTLLPLLPLLVIFYLYTFFLYLPQTCIGENAALKGRWGRSVPKWGHSNPFESKFSNFLLWKAENSIAFNQMLCRHPYGIPFHPC